MPDPYIRSNVLIVLTAIALVFSACASKDDVSPVDEEKQAFEDLRAGVREAIDDPARETEAIRLIDLLQSDLDRLRITVKERRRRVMDLNSNYDTPRAEFQAYLDAVQTEVRENRRRVSETHRAFLSIVTAEERDEVEKLNSKAMQSTVKSLQAI